MSATHEQVFENAQRLMEDARHLFNDKRYKSSISLAVLAAEEIGKILILSLPADLRGKDFRKHLSDHREKLNAFAVMSLFQIMERIELEALKTRGLPNNSSGRKELRKLTKEIATNIPEALSKLGISENGEM